MTGQWVAKISRDKESRLAFVPAQLLPQIAETEHDFWLTGAGQIADAQPLLAAIPYQGLFHATRDGKLRPLGKLLPTEILPELKWTSLNDIIAFSFPVAHFSRSSVPPAQITLVRSDLERPTRYLETSFSAWHDFAIETLEARLAPLSFAVASRSRVIVRGAPSPPLPGLGYWDFSGIAIPLGWVCDPPIDANSLRELFGMSPDETVLLNMQGSIERIPASCFIAATRESVRATQRHLDHLEGRGP